MINIYNIKIIFLLFIFYSVIGWIIEVLDQFYRQKRFINRGFLIGPYCPIYGFGGLYIYIFLNKYYSDPIALFFLTIVECAILEYLTSFVMEKIFKTRWWDYTDKKFNINGRICLETLVLFGLCGIISTYLINPYLIQFINFINPSVLNVLAIVLAIIFLVDSIVSFRIIYNFKSVANDVRKDSTNEITAKVKEVLKNKSIFSKRLVKAFPNFKTMLKKIKSDKND